MVPERVSFSGTTIDPMVFIRPRRFDGVIPIDWARIKFELNVELYKVEKWVRLNMSGRWGSYQLQDEDFNLYIVLCFEDDCDAVLFRLMDGAKVSQETD